MLKTFIRLLGDDAPVFRRYCAMALAYGMLSGLTITALVLALGRLLAGDAGGAALWLGVLLAGLVACWAWRRQVEKAGVRVGVAVLQGARQRLGDHVACLPVGWFTLENTAKLGHVITQGMMNVAQLPAHVLTPVICGAVTPVVMVASLCALHWQLGVIALLALPLLVGAMWLTAHLGQRADDAYHRHFAQTSQRLVEFAQAQSVLRAFHGDAAGHGVGDGGGTRFLRQAIDAQRHAGTRLIYLSALSSVLNAWAVQAIFAALLAAAALWLSSLPGAASGAQDAIAVIVALLLVVRFVDPLQEVASYGEVLRGARGPLDAAREMFAVQPLPEAAAPRAPRDASVDLRGVYFRYAQQQPDVLTDINLHCAQGSMTALIGASGSGKTTLVRLVARFFDASQGSVRVGGVDVREMSSEQLAGQISQIFQDSYLFQGSIADNIRIGKPGATDAELLEAARQAGVAEIIARLPQGLATPVGEGGARLSGGERQRIAIARALIKDAPILLVDEATAALDAENQAAIAVALARLRGKRTLIVIAHQLSTVAMADQIVVLDGGTLGEQGTPEQLRAQDGLYAHFLAQRQAAKGWRIAAPTRQAGTEPGI